jgi:hypothetical protein
LPQHPQGLACALSPYRQADNLIKFHFILVPSVFGREAEEGRLILFDARKSQVGQALYLSDEGHHIFGLFLYYACREPIGVMICF